MKKLVFLVLLMFLVLFIPTTLSSKKFSEDKVKVFVKLKDERRADFLGLGKIKLNEEEKQEIKQKVIGEINKDNLRQDFGDSFSAEISRKDLKILKKDIRVKSVIEMNSIHAFLQDSAGIVNATSVWSNQVNGINLSGAGETVCIIDTGINFSHPDLQGKNLTCNIDCLNKTCVENCSISDDHGHGTHVAGIVAANGTIKGIAPGARLIGLKVLDSGGSGSPDDLKKAIDWCINNALIYNISAISLSLGCNATKDGYVSYCDGLDDGCFCDGLTESINNATLRNITIVASTGNDGNFSAIASPACIQNATAVGASNKDGSIRSSSNRNSLTDFLAPGSDINSTSISGGYELRGGTSMAAPHIAAAFILLRQFKKLEKNQILLPNEIQNALNSTGKTINDASSGLDFMRIDIYSAILSLDETPPSVTLVLPTNNYGSSLQNQTFRCNATDLQLANITLEVWNSSALYYNNTTVVSGNFAEVEFNLTNMPFDSYEWNCLAADSKGNFSYAVSNLSLTIGNLSVTLISPENNAFTNLANTNFTCNTTTVSSTELLNITFYLWNSTSLLNTTITTLSGVQNSTTFYYNLTQELQYKWNCLVYNNETNSAFADSNNTITYDNTKPTINLTNPLNSSTYTSSNTVNFYYNVSDTNNISNCSLIINNFINKTDTNINNSLLNNITVYLANSIYNLNINCTDTANNQNSSETRVLTVNYQEEQQQQEQLSSSSGGGTPTERTYDVPEKEFEEGYTKNLAVKDKFKFNIKKQSHTLEVNKTTNNSVTIKISSETITVTLMINEIKKFNLSSANYYDLKVTLNSIENSKANLTMQKINELIKIKGAKNKTQNRTLYEIIAHNETEQSREVRIQDKWFLIILLIVILIIIVFLIINMWQTDEKQDIKQKPNIDTKKSIKL